MQKASAMAAALFTSLWLQAASAMPIVSIDLDPAAPGVQSSRSVMQGTTFAIDLVVSVDAGATGPAQFDTVGIAVAFNDSGAVLTSAASTPIAGSLAAFSATTSSLFGPFGPLTPGVTPLGTTPSSPPPGYASSSAAVLLTDFSPFQIAPGPAIDIFSLSFLAADPGLSTLTATGSLPGQPVLALGGSALAASLVPGIVTVTPSVPEPASTWLLAGALALLMGMRGSGRGFGAPRRRPATPRPE